MMRELGLEPCQPRPWRVSLTEGDGQEPGDSRPGATGISPLTRPARKWSATLPISRPGRAGFILATVIDCAHESHRRLGRG